MLTSCSSAASSAAVSSVNSVSVARWVAMVFLCQRRRYPAPLTLRPPYRLLVTDGREVELIQHVVHVAAQIDVGVEEVRELPVDERHPRCVLHDLLVER